MITIGAIFLSPSCVMLVLHDQFST